MHLAVLWKWRRTAVRCCYSERMRAYVLATFLVLFAVVPITVMAEVPPAGPAPATDVRNGCAPAAPAGVVPPSGAVQKPREITGKHVGDIIKQLDPSTHDTVAIGNNGRVTVTSRCGVSGQQGSVTMCLMNGICVKMSKDKAIAAKVEELQKDPRFQELLKSETPERAAQELVKQLFQVKPELQQQLSQSMGSILDTAFGTSGTLGGLTKDAVQKPADDIIRALATGDFESVAKASEELAGTLKKSGILEKIADPKQWSTLLETVGAGTLSPQAQEAFKALAGVACNLTGQQDCPPVLGGSLRGTEPIRAGLDRRIDPVEFAQRAAYKVAQSPLNGVAPAALRPFGITTGAPEEWARFFTMITKQESGLRVAVENADGTLQRFRSTLPGENSFGPGQFNIGEYGLKTWAEVNDPDRVIDAYIQVAQKGKLFQYFGSLQRPQETLQHGSWYQQTVAPYIEGGVPYVRPTVTTAATTFEQVVRTAAGGQVPTTVSGLGQLFSGIFTGNNTQQGIGGLLGSLFGGNSSLGGLLGMVPKLLGGLGSLGGNGSGGSASGNAAVQTNTPAPSGNGTPSPVPITQPSDVIPGLLPIVQPAVRLTVSPRAVERGGTYSILWAATGVDDARACRLYEEGATRSQIAIGNADSIVRQAPAVTSAQSLSFSLECTPKDTRADAARAKATARITIGL